MSTQPSRKDDQNQRPIYLISSILPSAKATGGGLVLHRHLQQRNDLNIKVTTVPLTKGLLFRWLEKSLLRTYIKAFSFYYEKVTLPSLRSLPKPRCVITVAHGNACYAAMFAARYWDVPLITFFHDWYPASSDVHPFFRWVPEIAFRKLYRKSSLALCVSKQMMKVLGSHANAIHLPPIPSSSSVSHNALHLETSPPRLLYSGFCGGVYRDMIRRFLDACRQENVVVSVSGAESSALPSDNSPNVSILGFLPENSYGQVFEASDILLLFIGFDSRNRKHFSTHFPSKLVEYCGRGKLIAIWGPSYSTAVVWAKETGAAIYFEADDASGFLKHVMISYQDRNMIHEVIDKASGIYCREFSPEVIHLRFRDEVLSVVGR